ncbi:WD40 repeat domain-containing protein [Chloroflexales bacterium ZM16-3]|nr:WD40 repeat domain-containing protein [Chloroflexales bacterium ZM16-3]
MDLSKIASIRHESHIFALALSRDERLLACGGAESAPITVWDLSTGALVARLAGLSRQAHALAFSPDSSLLAAANLWGGLCVWGVAESDLLEARPEAKSRRIRSLVYPDSARRTRLPVMLSESIHSQTRRALAPNGKLLASSFGAADVKIMQYRTTTELGALELSKYESLTPGVSAMAWSADSRALALAGRGWAGVWLPLEDKPSFYATGLPSNEEVGGLAVLSDSRQIIYALGRELAALDLPQTPLLTAWQTFMSRVPDPPTESGFKARREWTWGATQWGYEGVHSYEGCLLWFSHSHNPHAGGGASEQSFASFLKDGPAQPIPDHLLIEVAQSVRALAEPTD